MEEDEFTVGLLENVASLEKLLGIRSGFFNELGTEDDWSFVIKTHALVESGLTRLLESKVSPTIPQEFINRLDLSGSRHSKLKLLELLGLVKPTQVRFVRGLSRIRNRLVHNITHVGFVLADYVASLSPRDALLFVTETCGVFYDETLPISERKEHYAAILAHPKIFVWRTALLFLALTSLTIDLERLKAELEQQERKKLLADAETARRITLGLGGGSPGATAYRELLRQRQEGSSVDSGGTSNQP
jgi:hypothetical protein